MSLLFFTVIITLWFSVVQPVKMETASMLANMINTTDFLIVSTPEIVKSLCILYVTYVINISFKNIAILSKFNNVIYV